MSDCLQGQPWTVKSNSEPLGEDDVLRFGADTVTVTPPNASPWSMAYTSYGTSSGVVGQVSHNGLTYDLTLGPDGTTLTGSVPGGGNAAPLDHGTHGTGIGHHRTDKKKNGNGAGGDGSSWTAQGGGASAGGPPPPVVCEPRSM